MLLLCLDCKERNIMGDNLYCQVKASKVDLQYIFHKKQPNWCPIRNNKKIEEIEKIKEIQKPNPLSSFDINVLKRKQYLTPRETAIYLSCSVPYVYKLINEKHIEAVKFIKHKRGLRILRNALDTFIIASKHIIKENEK